MRYYLGILICVLLIIIIVAVHKFMNPDNVQESDIVSFNGFSSSREKRMSIPPQTEDPLDLYKSFRLNKSTFSSDSNAPNSDALHAQVKETPLSSDHYNYRGANLAIKEAVARGEEAKKLLGGPQPIYPYKANMDSIYAALDRLGYNKDTLFEFYVPVLDTALTLSEDVLKKAPKTWHILELFKSNMVNDITGIINDRLYSNEFDIVALLLLHNLDTEQGKGQAAFRDAQRIINAIQHIEIKGLDERAILCHILDDLSMTFAYQTESSPNVEDNRQITNGCYPILYMMEIAGDW